MYDLLYVAVLCSVIGLALAALYILFSFAMFLLYKANGGRYGIIPYLRKYL